MAVLGELSATSGLIARASPPVYSSQEAWVLNASIRDNVVFGHTYDEAWYLKGQSTDLHFNGASIIRERRVG